MMITMRIMIIIRRPGKAHGCEAQGYRPLSIHHHHHNHHHHLLLPPPLLLIIIFFFLLLSNRGCAPEPATEPDSVTRRPANEARETRKSTQEDP